MGCICPVIIPYYNMLIYFTKKMVFLVEKRVLVVDVMTMGPKGGRFKQKFDSAGW